MRPVRIALAVLVFVLSLALMDGPAHALAGPPVPVDIDKTLATAASKWVVKEEVGAGSSVACGPGAPLCLGVTTAVSAGLFAYDTRDLWMPVASNWLQGFTSDDESSRPQSMLDLSGCASLTNGTANTNSRWQGVSVTVSGPPCTSDTLLQVNGEAFCQNGSRDVFALPVAANYQPAPSGVYRPEYNGVCANGGNAASVRYTVAGVGADTLQPNAQGVSVVVVAGYDPDHNVQVTTVECLNTLTGQTGSFTTNDAGVPDRIVLPSCRAHFGDGWVPRKVRFSVGSDARAQSNQIVATDTTDWSGEYADCLDGVGNPTCKVTVWIGSSPCSVGATGCVNWQRYAQTHPDQVTCRFGVHIVALSDCNSLQRQFEVGSTIHTVTTTRTDGAPDTGEDPGRTSDPGSGPDPDPQPSPDPSPDPATEPFPRTGANPGAPSVLPDGSSDADSASCYGSGWTWDPVSWVLVPVKCSLLWAFKPPPGYVDSQLSSVRAVWAATSPGQYVGALASLVTLPNGSGCQGVPVDVDLGHGVGVHQRLAAACDGDRLHAVSVVVRVALSAFIVVGGGFACARAVMSGLGMSLPSASRSGESG